MKIRSPRSLVRLAAFIAVAATAVGLVSFAAGMTAEDVIEAVGEPTQQTETRRGRVVYRYVTLSFVRESRPELVETVFFGPDGRVRGLNADRPALRAEAEGARAKARRANFWRSSDEDTR